MNAPATQEPALANPQEGDVLAGKYRVESVLGKGGMGVVVAATHLQLGQRVAIKYLIQPGNADIVARFLREARAAVRLRSEHVARVVDVGELDNGAPYMVMEYLRGADLLHHLKTQGPLQIQEAIGYILQTCEAIAEAHSSGIVHRDLKPANLFLTTTPDGSKSIKVLDFGISKVSENESDGGDGMQLTKTEMVLGSPLYMSPEQIKSSKDVDPRSDIWALGVILYQLLAGKVPFRASGFSELVLKVNLEAPPPLAEVRGDIPPRLEAAILKCLEKHRENRFQNIGELALAVAEFGAPTAYISADKAARVLEGAGVAVQTPPGVVRGQPSISGSMAAWAVTPSQPPPPPIATGSIPPPAAITNLQSSPPTGMMSISPPGMEPTRAPAARQNTWLVIAAVAALAGAAAGAAFFLRGSSSAPADSPVVADKPAAPAPAAAAEPQVKPVAPLNTEPTVAAAVSSALPAASATPAGPATTATPKANPPGAGAKAAPTSAPSAVAPKPATTGNVLKETTIE